MAAEIDPFMAGMWKAAGGLPHDAMIRHPIGPGWWDSVSNSPVFAASLVALIGALLTLFGVYLNIRNTNKNAAIDRKQEITEAQVDRLATGRRDVYLAAVRDIIRAQSIIADLADSDMLKSTKETVRQNMASAVGRLSVVAEPKTISIARQLDVELLELYFEANIKAWEINRNRKTSEKQKTEITELQNNIKDYIARIAENLGSTHADANLDLLLKNSLQTAVDKLQHSHLSFNQQRLANIQQHTGFAIWVEEAGSEVRYSFEHLLCAVRKELSLDADVEYFLEDSTRLHVRKLAATKKMIADISPKWSQPESGSNT